MSQHRTVEPGYEKVARDWQNLFTILNKVLLYRGSFSYVLYVLLLFVIPRT